MDYDCFGAAFDMGIAYQTVFLNANNRANETTALSSRFDDVLLSAAISALNMHTSQLDRSIHHAESACDMDLSKYRSGLNHMRYMSNRLKKVTEDEVSELFRDIADTARQDMADIKEGV